MFTFTILKDFRTQFQNYSKIFGLGYIFAICPHVLRRSFIFVRFLLLFMRFFLFVLYKNLGINEKSSIFAA